VPAWLTVPLVVAVLALLVGAARLWFQWRGRTRPKLRVEAFCNGSSGANGVGITVQCWNEGGGHAHRVTIRAFLGDQREQVHEELVDLPAGAADVRRRFALQRPERADLIPACNNDVTLYGDELEVELHWNGRRRARFTFVEPEYDPTTDRGRYDAKHEHWRAHGRTAS
jgi:hypothetical protein